MKTKIQGDPFKMSQAEWDDLVEQHGDLTYCQGCSRIMRMDDLDDYGTDEIGAVYCTKTCLLPKKVSNRG